MEDSVNVISEMNQGIKEFNTELNKTDLLMGGIGDTLKTISTWAGAATITLGLKDMVSSLMKINEAATKSAVILGQKAFGKDLKNSIKEISTNITQLQKEIGVSTDKAKELTNAFLKARITENLHDATSAAAMFQRATDADTKSIMSMYNEMYHGADMSTDSINSVLANMSKVQHTIGLSEEGMNAAVSAAGKLSVQLRGFGATDRQINNMTVSLTKFVSSMEKVGVSAQNAAAWVEKLTNPDNIENNIGLYAQLGISMEDALSGNFDAMGAGMQEFSQRIVDMGPIAGAAYAKQFGYSYSEAVKTAKLEDGGIVDTDPQEQALNSLKQMSEEVLGVSGNIEKTFNQIKGSILELGPAILTALGVGIALLKSKVLAKVKKGIAGVISGGIQEGIEGANISAGLTGLFKKNFDKMNKTGGGYDSTGDKKAIHQALSASGSGVFANLTDTFSIYNAQVKKARVENANAELTQLAQVKIQREKAYEAEIQSLEKLKGTITDEKVLKKIQDRIDVMTSNSNSRAKSAATLFLRGGQKYQTAAVKNMALQELDEKRTGLESKRGALQGRKDDISSAFRMLKANKEGTKDFEEALARMAKETGKATDDIISAINDKAITSIEEFGNKIGSEEITNFEKNLTRINSQLSTVEHQRNKIDGMQARDPNVGFLGRVKNKISNTAEGVSGRFEDWKLKNGGGSFGKAVGNTAGRAMIGLGKSIASLGLKMGVMGILMTLLKPLISTLKEKLAPVLETIQNAVSDIFASDDFQDLINCIVDLAKQLAPVVIDIFKAFTPIIKLLANIVVKLVQALMPPLLWMLGQLIKVGGHIIGGLGSLLHLESLQKTGEGLVEAGENMVELSKTIKDNKGATEENTKVVKEGDSKAAEMRVASRYGSTMLVESGAVSGRDPSSAETAASMRETKAIMQSQAKDSEEYKEAQKTYNEALAKGNFEIQKAVNLILEKLTGYSGYIPVECHNA